MNLKITFISRIVVVIWLMIFKNTSNECGSIPFVYAYINIAVSFYTFQQYPLRCIFRIAYSLIYIHYEFVFSMLGNHLLWYISILLLLHAPVCNRPDNYPSFHQHCLFENVFLNTINLSILHLGIVSDIGNVPFEIHNLCNDFCNN